MVKKFVLLAGGVGITCVEAMNPKIKPRDARNLYETVQNVNPQLVDRIQNRDGQTFIPLNEARDLISTIVSIANSGNFYNWALDLFGQYENNVTRRNIGSFTKLWDEFTEQANRPIAEDVSDACGEIAIKEEGKELEASVTEGIGEDGEDNASVPVEREEETHIGLSDSRELNTESALFTI